MRENDNTGGENPQDKATEIHVRLPKKAIEGLMQQCEFGTPAELFRHALAVLGWVADQTAQGYLILAVRAEEGTAKQLDAPFMKRVRGRALPSEIRRFIEEIDLEGI